MVGGAQAYLWRMHNNRFVSNSTVSPVSLAPELEQAGLFQFDLKIAVPCACRHSPRLDLTPPLPDMES